MILRRVGSYAASGLKNMAQMPTKMENFVRNERRMLKGSPSVNALGRYSSKNIIPKEHFSKLRRRVKYLRLVVPERPLFRWLLLGTLTAGTIIYAWQVFAPDYRTAVDPIHYYTDWKIRFYTSMPWNAVSRVIGVAANFRIPVMFREPLYGAFVRAYDCNMDEAVISDLKAYPTFSEFFNRELKPGVRPISASLLVSPADGTVLHYGKVVNGRVEYVKGNDFEIHEFLGPINVDTKNGYSIFQVVIYLAPGDYHAFHSPSNWKVLEKVHHPGYLLSVRPSYIDWIPKIFCMNERVVLSGVWDHGYFSMSAVAATNVGDIVIKTKSARNRKLLETEHYNIFDQNFHLTSGAKVGEFRLGSTIVLIFEAPSNLEFCIKAGDTLRYGESLVLQGQ